VYKRFRFFFLVIFFLGEKGFQGKFIYAAAAKRTDALHSLQKKECRSLTPYPLGHTADYNNSV
jgi:hypothetical protein